jgi:hypothetical protein
MPGFTIGGGPHDALQLFQTDGMRASLGRNVLPG